jgi:hypothetical protein
MPDDELIAAAKRNETLLELGARYVGRQTSRTAEAVLRDAYAVALDSGPLPKQDAAWRFELSERMHGYVDARAQALGERERVPAEQTRAHALGLSRFAGPGRSLDELLEPTRKQIRQAGGLTAEHLRSIGRHSDQQQEENRE